ncbi:MAG: alpha/beta hydrolase [Saprospiraceae bacterium]|nr:alpha/beta hydrolase [Saprospiraceae bacterium]
MKDQLADQHQEIRTIPGLFFWGAILRWLSWISPRLASKLVLFFFTFPGRKARHYRQDHLFSAARRSWVMMNGKRLRVYQWGEGQRRILLLHGWQSRGTALRYLVPSFVERGLTVIAMDAPGHGESSGWRTTLVSYAKAIRAVDDMHGPFEGAITHSFGGRALAFALAFEDYPWQIKQIVMLAAPNAYEEIIDTFMVQLGLPEKLKPAVLHRMAQMLGRSVTESEIFSMGELVKARILLLHDEQDQIVPMWEAERIASRLPGVRLMKTRGYGHFRMAKSPEIWEVCRRFLLKGNYQE